MAINAATPVYGTNQIKPLTAVVDVDIRGAVPYAPGAVSAGAQVVYIAGSLDSTGAPSNGSSIVVGNIASGAADSGNPVKIGGVFNTTPATLTNGQRGNLQLGTLGSLRVQLMVPDANNPATFTGAVADAVSNPSNIINSSNFGVIFNGTTWDRVKKANLVGRLASSAATTNATSVKASAGNVQTIIATNTTAALKYLKLYNKASAPVVGTDTPIMTLAIPPNNAEYYVDVNGSAYFSTGIAYALTGAAADADTTALAAGDVVGLNILYS